MARFDTTPDHDVLRTMLREARERAGVSQRELCRRLGRSYSMVYKIEVGERGVEVLEAVHYLQEIGANPRVFFDEFFERIGQSTRRQDHD